MAARTGKQVLQRFREDPPNLWINGERVTDPTTHPSTRNAVNSLAALYDMQHSPELVEKMTVTSPTSGDLVGRSFVIPKSKEDLCRRSEMHKVWADASLGHMGRTPDYMNVNVMAAGTAGEYFAQIQPRFGENIANYFEYVRENDLTLTHALTSPQIDKSKQVNEFDDPYIALGVVKETSSGIIVRGARMLATLPLSDEILIFPSTVLKGGSDLKPYALGFSVPNSAEGLRFQCREPLDLGRSHADHPLGSRFDEMDALVIFDDVLVPWERVFLIDDVDLANQAYGQTGAVLHMAHQVVNLKIAKTEAILGTLQSVINMIGTSDYPHVQEMVAEVIVTLEIMKALKIASEETASLNRYGVMTPGRGPLDAARNYYPAVHRRLIEILQLCSSSGLIMIPTEADRLGEGSADIKKFLQGKNGDSDERLKLFRLAWDMSLSSFGGRQGLYEQFFFGDPVRMKQALYGIYDRQPYVDRINAFIADDGEPNA